MRSRMRRPAPPAYHRMVRCLSCRQPLRLALAVKQRGICAPCLAELALVGWRLVYDRDRRIGAIPRNLRAAYSL